MEAFGTAQMCTVFECDSGDAALKHPSTYQLFAYWNRKRGNTRVPELGDIERYAMRELPGDGFVLSCGAGYPFRVAGTRICGRFGYDLTNHEFPALFDEASRHDAEEVVALVGDEMIPAVTGITTTTSDGTQALLELLLLPCRADAQVPISLAGVLAPLPGNGGLLGKLTLNSWRFIHPPLQECARRTVHKRSLAHGLVVYDGTAPAL